MRSALVLQAELRIRNRYLLIHAASKITRKFHSRKERIQETVNGSFQGLGAGMFFLWPDRTINCLVTGHELEIAAATCQATETPASE